MLVEIEKSVEKPYV